MARYQASIAPSLPGAKPKRSIKEVPGSAEVMNTYELLMFPLNDADVKTMLRWVNCKCYTLALQRGEDDVPDTRIQR